MVHTLRTMPRCHFLRHLFFLLLLLSPWTSSSAAEPSNQISVRAGGRSLLQSDENTELVVDLSGKVSLIMQPSERAIWSLSTGSPIRSSYQAPPSVMNNTENATEISKALVVEYIDKFEVATVDDGYTRKTMEDLVNEVPLVTNDGLTLGSKTSTTYMLDGLSGRLLQVYQTTSSSGDNNNSNVMVKPTSTDNLANLQLFITRTDLKLEHFDKTSQKLWNVTGSHFRADLRCDLAFNKDKKLGPEIITGIYMPLLCGGNHTDIRPLIKSGVFIRMPQDEQVKPESAYEAKMLPSTTTRESRKLWEHDVFSKDLGWSPVKLLVPLFVLVAVISVFIKTSSSRGGDLNSKSGPCL